MMKASGGSQELEKRNIKIDDANPQDSHLAQALDLMSDVTSTKDGQSSQIEAPIYCGAIDTLWKQTGDFVIERLIS